MKKLRPFPFFPVCNHTPFKSLNVYLEKTSSTCHWVILFVMSSQSTCPTNQGRNAERRGKLCTGGGFLYRRGHGGSWFFPSRPGGSLNSATLNAVTSPAIERQQSVNRQPSRGGCDSSCGQRSQTHWRETSDGPAQTGYCFVPSQTAVVPT